MASKKKKRSQTKPKQSTPSQAAPSQAAPSQAASSVSPPSDSGESPPEALGEVAARMISQLPSLSRVMSVVMLIFGIVAVGILFYRVMAVFFVPLFMAAALVVIFRPVHEWLLKKLNGKCHIAAVSTTILILLIVLLPLLITLSVAATQFTSLVGQADFNDLTQAINRARVQFGLTLEHPELFRRLDDLADSLDEPREPESVLAHIDEARKLVVYLQKEVDGPESAEAAEAIANAKLDDFEAAVRETIAVNALEQDSNIEGKVFAEDQFHRQSVIASASIRSWMHSLLGGSFRSQAKLLANPSESEFAQLLSKARETLQPRFVKFTSATGVILLRSGVGLVILMIAVYFFLIDGPSMIRTLMRLSPLDNAYELQLLSEFDKTSRAVVLASISSALVQGFLAAIAFYFCGLESFVLLFLVTCLMALVPFLGAASVWIPCALYLGAVDQRWGLAIALAIYGALIVSSVDNVIKAYVLHGHSQLHPLFALLSVLGGVHVFGPIGLLVGPMVVVFLQTLLEILSHELAAGSDPDPAATSSPQAE